MVTGPPQRGYPAFAVGVIALEAAVFLDHGIDRSYGPGHGVYFV